MNKVLSLSLVVCGIVLLGYSASASDSLGSDITRFLTGSPTNRTVWMLVGGALFTLVGGFGLVSRPKDP
jgi:hypothetical protein